MPRNDYECTACGKIQRDVVTVWPARPSCCGVTMEWLPGGGHVDSFSPFETEVGDTRVLVCSLHQARAIERDAERATANKEGQPMIFRHLSQDRNNMDCNVFGPPPNQNLTTRDSRGNPYVTRKGAFTGEDHG